MLNNNVFKVPVDMKKWGKAAVVRAAKTAAQTALSMITVGQAVLDVDWVNVLSVSAVAALMSLLTSLNGLPEVESEENV